MIKEKYEDRGWHLGENINNTSVREKVNPLALTNEEYNIFMPLLAKLALMDKDPDLCALYFELQRRAFYGNGYPYNENGDTIEQQMWSLGEEKRVESVEKHVL